jgi:hypothetical protein
MMMGSMSLNPFAMACSSFIILFLVVSVVYMYGPRVAIMVSSSCFSS